MQINVMSSSATTARNSKSSRNARRVRQAVTLAITALSLSAYEGLTTSRVDGQTAYYLLPNGDTSGNSSFINGGTGAGWSTPLGATPVTHAVAAGNTYVVQQSSTNALVTLRSPNSGGNVTFAGDSLTMNANTRFLLKDQGTAVGVLTINNFISNGTNIDDAANGTFGNALAGNMTLGTGFTTGFGDNLYAPFQVMSNVSGSGNVTIGDSFGAGYQIVLSGNNTYTGTTSFYNNNTNTSLVIGSTNALQNSTLSTVAFVNSGTSSSNTTVGNGTGIVFASGIGNFTFGGLSDSVAGTTFGNIALSDAGGNAVALSIGNNNTNTFYSGVLSGNGSLTKVGSGILTLAGSSTYTGSTTVSAGGLVVAGSLNGSSSLSLNSGASLSLSGNATIAGPTTLSGAALLTLSGSSSTALTTNGLLLGDGNGFGIADTSVLNYIASSGSVEPIALGSGALTVNASGAYVSVSGISALGNYTLLSYGSQTGPGSFSLSNTSSGVTTLNLGRQTYTLADSSNSLVLQVTGTSAPNVAYFNAAVSSAWNDVSNASKVNFSTNLAGTADAGNVPGSSTDVILDASTKAGAAVTSTLGASTAINSLTVNSQAASNTIAADGSTLTINGLADSNTASDGSYTGNAAGVGISMLAGSGPLTVNVPIRLGGSGAAQTWINASASNLSTGATISATGVPQTLTLLATGAGNIVLGGSESDGAGQLGINVNTSGSGMVVFSGTGIGSYSGATQIAAGTLQVPSGGVLATSGAITVGTTSSPTTLNVAGGTVNESGALVLSSVANANATLNITGGTFNYSSGSSIQVGLASGSTNNITMTGGIFNSTSTGTIYLNNAGAGVTNSNLTLSNNAVFSAPSSPLVLGQYGDTTNALNVSTATLTLSGSAALNVSSITLGGANNSAYENGIINLNGGTITTASIRRGGTLVATSATAQVLNANGGTLQATGNNADYLAGAFVNLSTGGLNFNTAGFTVNITNAMSGGGGLTKIGTGTLSVSGSNTYSGATNISAGTLSIGYGGTTGVLPLASQLNDSSVLAFNRSNTAVQGVDFPLISGTGSVAQNGAGITQLTLNNTYTGKTAINAGVLDFTNSQALYSGNQSAWTPGNIQISGGALGVFLGTGGFASADAANFISTLSANGVLTKTAPVALDPGTTGTVTYSPILADGPNPLAVVKPNTGTLILAGSNTYTGGTNISNGVLILGNPLALGTAGSPVLETGNGMLGITSDSQFAPGSLNLTNYAVNYSSGVGIAFQNYNSSVNITNVATIRLGAASGVPSAILGNVSGTGTNSTLTFSGPGTLTLAGTVQDNQLFVSQGTLALSGLSASVNATAYSSIGLNPGDNGNLVLENGAVFTSTSDLNISDTSGLTANTGVVTIADATSGLNVANLYVGKGNAVETPANNIGTVNQLAGAANVSGGFVIGSYGVGTYNLSGGTLNLGNSSSFNLGLNAGAISNLNISGTGEFNDPIVLNGNTGVLYVGNTGAAGASSNITISGNGSFNAPNAQLSLGQSASNTSALNASTATLNMSGNATLTVAKITFGGPNNAFYLAPVINLNGGTIITGSITRGAIQASLLTGPTVAAINANGGTIQASAANASFFNGDYINLEAGGLNFNSGGYVVTSLTAMSGVGGFIKSGAGLLTLSGSDTYAGTTNVSGGALRIAQDSALPISNNVIVGKAAVLIAADQNIVNSTSLINMNGSMIIYGGDLGATVALAKTGYNNGRWNGSSGIFSSAAAADTNHLTALGVIINDDGTGNALYPSTFEGQSTIDGDILVKYTYYGDTDLSGTVDGTDYSRIDAAYLNNRNPSNTPLQGWYNGDFNYDGVIDGSDYTLMDNAFNSQGANIAAEIASPTAQIAGGAATSSVPEPTTLGLLGIGVAGLLGRRRRSR